MEENQSAVDSPITLFHFILMLYISNKRVLWEVVSRLVYLLMMSSQKQNKLLCILFAGSMRGWWKPPPWTYPRTPPSGSARETPPTAPLRLAAAR